METLAYAVRLAPAKEGGYVVTCRDLPEVVTQGDNFAEARAQASDAMDEAFAARIDDGEDFPETGTSQRGICCRAKLGLERKGCALPGDEGGRDFQGSARTHTPSG